MIPGTDISTVLRKCLVLATRLGHEGFRKRVERELNGYKHQDQDDLPPYCVLHVESLGDFVGPFGMQARGAPIPPRNAPEKFRKSITQLPLVDGVAALESLARSDKDLMAPWPADLIAALADKFYEDMNCVRAWLPRNAIVGMVDTVRNRILSFVLQIEKQYPEGGEVAAGGARAIPQDRVNQYFQTFIMGGTNIALGSSSV